MPITFDDTPSLEPSALVGFSQNRLVRDAENRDETSLKSALDSSDSRFYLFAKGKVLIHKGEESHSSFTLEDALAFDPKLERAVLLGEAVDGPRIALPVGIDPETLEEPWKGYDLRSLLY